MYARDVGTRPIVDDLELCYLSNKQMPNTVLLKNDWSTFKDETRAWVEGWLKCIYLHILFKDAIMSTIKEVQYVSQKIIDFVASLIFLERKS